jgi:hypothetical protein
MKVSPDIASRTLLGVGSGRGDLTNIQCKAILNCHNESPLYNEYMLIKNWKKPLLKWGLVGACL